MFPRVQDDPRRVQGQDEAGRDDPDAGRHVATYDGDEVFIPKLNLDDQWSMEDAKLVDRSCQTSRKSKKSKSKKQHSKVRLNNF